MKFYGMGSYWFSPGLRIKENKEVYEGEVIELAPEFSHSEVKGLEKEMV